MEIQQILNRIYPLPERSIQKMKQHIQEVDFPKGHILLHADCVETTVFFIKKGIARAYSPTPDDEQTFWFGKEGDPVISMKSYVNYEKGYENIELLEDSQLYKIKSADLQKLYFEDIHIANWGRKFAEQELIKTEKRLISRQFLCATERYKELLEQNPELLRRVQLGHIASFLGITQVSLSRIRAEIK